MARIHLHWITLTDGPESSTTLRISRAAPGQPDREAILAPRITITRGEAGELWPALKTFAETGRPPEPPEAT